MKSIIILVFLLILTAGELSKSLEKKVDKAIKRSFKSENVIREQIIFNEPFEDLPDPGLILYSLEEDGYLLGYLIVTTTKGRFEYFDYAVILNHDLSIRDINVLIYRSEHGYEIGKKSWLNQFRGEKGCDLEYGEQIDAISGATYSASSITADINKLCLLLQRLYDQKIIQ